MLSVSSSRWFWRTTTRPGCRRVTPAGTSASPKRVDLAEGRRLSQTSKKCTSWSAFLQVSSQTCSTAASPLLARGTGGRRRPVLVLTHSHNTACIKDPDMERAWIGVTLTKSARCRSLQSQMEVKFRQTLRNQRRLGMRPGNELGAFWLVTRACMAL